MSSITTISFFLWKLSEPARKAIGSLVAGEEDMQIIAEYGEQDEVEFLERVRERYRRLCQGGKNTSSTDVIFVDVVVTATKRGESPGLSSQLLGVNPELTILGISYEDGAAFVEQLCPQRRQLPALSSGNFANELRKAVLFPCP